MSFNFLKINLFVVFGFIELSSMLLSHARKGFFQSCFSQVIYMFFLRSEGKNFASVKIS